MIEQVNHLNLRRVGFSGTFSPLVRRPVQKHPPARRVSRPLATGRLYGTILNPKDPPAMDHDLATHESSELFRVVAETASDAIISIDHDSIILFANRAAERVFGYSLSEMLGREVTFLMPEYLRHVHRTAVYSYVTTGQKHASWAGLQLKGLHKSGAEIPLEVSFGEHVRDGRHIFTGILRDVSERNQIDRELRDSREKYAKMIQSSPDAITLRSLPDRRYVEVSEGFARLTGYTADEVIGKTPSEVGVWSDDASHAEILEKLRRDGEVRDAEFRFRTKTGEARYATVSAVQLTLGNDSYMLSISRDITERRKAEERLSQLAAIVESSFDAIIGKTLDGTIVSWNASAEAVYGYSAAEAVGQSIAMLAPAEQRHDVDQLLDRLARGEKIDPHETVRVRKDGQKIIVSVTLSPIRDASGNVVGASAISRDITERRRFEQDLRRSEARFASLVQDAPYGIYRVTLDGQFLQVNPALVRMLGYQSEAALLACNIETDVDAKGEFRRQLIEADWRHKDFMDVEAHWKRKSGERIVVRLSGRPVECPEGKLAYFEVFAEDITERRSLEKQLLQSQKMDAIGRLAGGVAHDFNNLLGVILGQTELLQAEFGSHPSFHRRAEAIEQSARRAADLTKQLLAFSRQQLIEPRVVDLNAIVRDVEKLLRRLIGEDVELMSHLQPNAGNIKIDPSQLEQILMNLAVNARDAMPDGGKLILETAFVELDEAYARQHLGARAGDFVMVAVSDTGTGMDSQTITRIFEPFFTTKAEGRGTGLGLSTVYGIVKQNNGYITPYSEVGHGTTFRIYFPRVWETPEVRDQKSNQGEFAKGCETILVVEDETSLRELARELLETNGYQVIEAERAEKAIQLVESSQTPIDLLLTDVVMPGMGGKQLATRLRELRPDLLVLYMSGYTDDVINNRGVLPENTLFLHKPFTRATLLRRVREALDAKTSLNSF
jgi:two-component system cell cycle sensor histidine kinase/response regulator CckA